MELYQNALITVNSMLQKRGYDTSNISKDEDKIKSIIELKYIQDTDLIFWENKKQKYIFVKFIMDNSIKPTNIRDLLNNLAHSELLNVIIIVKKKPNNTILKLIKDYSHIQLEFFWIYNLQKDITEHKYVPKHVLLTQEEISIMKQNYNIKSNYDLPVMLKNDPVSKFYGFKKGDICKIIRKSHSVGESIYYRIVK